MNTKHQVSEEQRRKAGKKAAIQKKEAAKQENLKQQWLEWSSKFANEEEALAEGVWACEQLARCLEVSTKRRIETEHFYFDPCQDEDLSRLVQFNEIKNLWLKRNIINILSAKKLQLEKCNRGNQFGCTELWEETFFSYLESVQLYLYKLKVCDRYYTFFTDSSFAQEVIEELIGIQYGKQLTLDEKQAIGKSFAQLVLIVERGAREFWKKRWSKQQDILLPDND